MAKRSPAVDVIHKNGLNEPIMLSTGIEVRLVPVPITAIQDASLAISDPKVPMIEVEGKDYPIPNPEHPDYIEAKNKAFRERVQAGFDVMAMLGIKLIDGLPEDDTWLKELKFLEKRGRLDLSGYDLTDEFEKEFIYKRYYAMGAEDWNALSVISGVTEEEIAQASDSFRD